MQGKVAVSLILFLFPALIVPLFLLAFLTRLPGDLGAFFTNYSFAVLWGAYLLLLAGAIFLYFFFKRRAARQALAESAAPDAGAQEPQAQMAESQHE
jgi:membrane protease YdiL (CAAX protease family)